MYRYRADGLLGDQHHSSGGLRATSLRSAETKLGQNRTRLHTRLSCGFVCSEISVNVTKFIYPYLLQLWTHSRSRCDSPSIRTVSKSSEAAEQNCMKGHSPLERSSFPTAGLRSFNNLRNDHMITIHCSIASNKTSPSKIHK